MDPNFNTLATVLHINPENNLQIIRAELTSDLNLAIDLINLENSTINSVTFAVKYKDINNSPLFNDNETFYTVNSLEILPKSIYYLDPIKIDSRFSDARAIEIRLKEIKLDNSKTHVYPEENNEEFILEIILDEKKKKIRDILGPDIITYGKNTPHGWRCVCGTFNPKYSEECKNCKRNKSFVLNNLTEALINMKLVNSISNTNTSREDQKELFSKLTQTQMSKVAPTTSVLEKTRINENNTLKQKKSKTKLIFISFLLLILFLLSFVLFKIFDQYNNKKIYEEAKVLINQGQYQKANKELNKIKNSDELEIEPLLDKTKLLIESKKAFDEGNKLILSKRYIDSVKKFKEVLPEDNVNYSSAQNKISDLENIILNIVEEKIEERKYREAQNLVDEYLSIVEESAKANTLKESIYNRSKAEEALSQDELDGSIELEKSRAEISKKAENIINTYQKVQLKQANLRKEPSLNSEILTKLPKGSDLYIKETKIEGIERIWCKVDAVDSMSKESFSGWISNKTMETSN